MNTIDQCFLTFFEFTSHPVRSNENKGTLTFLHVINWETLHFKKTVNSMFCGTSAQAPPHDTLVGNYWYKRLLKRHLKSMPSSFFETKQKNVISNVLNVERKWKRNEMKRRNRKNFRRPHVNGVTKLLKEKNVCACVCVCACERESM